MVCAFILNATPLNEITRPLPLEVGGIEQRESLMVNVKVQTWLKQLLDFAKAMISGTQCNYAYAENH